MSEKQLPASIERVRSLFEEWRAHKNRGDRIPEGLWCVAVEAARHHGVHAISRAVRLEHAELRRRFHAASTVSNAPSFIELDAPAAGSVGCTVELEKVNGTRMRICVREGASVDWSWMKDAFLGA